MNQDVDQARTTKLRRNRRILWWIGAILLLPGNLVWINPVLVLFVLSGASDIAQFSLYRPESEPDVLTALLRLFLILSAGYLCWIGVIVVGLDKDFYGEDYERYQRARRGRRVGASIFTTVTLILCALPYWVSTAITLS